jgi:hypothetical protein
MEEISEINNPAKLGIFKLLRAEAKVFSLCLGNHRWTNILNSKTFSL